MKRMIKELKSRNTVLNSELSEIQLKLEEYESNKKKKEFKNDENEKKLIKTKEILDEKEFINKELMKCGKQ